MKIHDIAASSRRLRGLSLLAAASTLTTSLCAQTVLSTTTASTSAPYFAQSIASGGDDRYIIGGNLTSTGPTVNIVNAISGAIVGSITSPSGQYGDLFGRSVAGGFDLNQDGYNDFCIGAPAVSNGTNHAVGRVYVISGMDLTTVLKDHEGAQNETIQSGQSVANVGDVNNDGLNDYAYGMPGLDVNGVHDGGRVKVRSGLDGSKLWQFDGLSDREAVGLRVYAAGDVNNDGFDDVAVYGVAPKLNTDINRGRLRMLSGLDGSQLWAKTGDDFAFLGSQGSATGDWNGDNRSDFAFYLGSGAIRIVRGDTGATLFDIDSEFLNGTQLTFGGIQSDSGLYGGRNLFLHATNANAVMLYAQLSSNAPPTRMSVIEVPGASLSQFGLSMAALGDVTNDIATGPGNLIAIAPEIAISSWDAAANAQRVNVCSVGQFASPLSVPGQGLSTLTFLGEPSTSLTLEARGGTPNAQAYLFYSQLPSAYALGNGPILYVNPNFAPIPFTFDANGSLTVTIPPFSGLGGAKVFTQIITEVNGVAVQSSNGYMLN